MLCDCISWPVASCPRRRNRLAYAPRDLGCPMESRLSQWCHYSDNSQQDPSAWIPARLRPGWPPASSSCTVLFAGADPCWNSRHQYCALIQAAQAPPWRPMYQCNRCRCASYRNQYVPYIKRVGSYVRGLNLVIFFWVENLIAQMLVTHGKVDKI